MEIIKENIHMGRIRAEGTVQVSFDEDMNIPDQKPDVTGILLQKGEAVTEEVKAGNDTVTIKGRLLYHVLYGTNEAGCQMVDLDGSLPFEEKVHLPGTAMTDQVRVEVQVEDLTIGMINSRKLSIQALLQFNACVEDIYDEALPVDIRGEEQVEYRKAPVCMSENAVSGCNMPVARLCMSKRDVLRVSDECVLPSNYPNVSGILSHRLRPVDMEFKLREDALEISGELQLSVIYEGEGEGHPVRAYETMLSFNKTQECPGVRGDMIPDILYTLGQKEVSLKPDRDGEERCLQVEVSFDMNMRMYEEIRPEMITDVYGVHKDVTTQSHQGTLQGLLGSVSGKMKITDHVALSATGDVLQILNCDAESTVPAVSIQKDGVVVKGSLLLNIICITGNDEMPFVSCKAQLPYRYVMEVPGIQEGDKIRVHVQTEQLQTGLMDGNEADVRAVLSFQAIAFRCMETEIIDRILVSDADKNAIKKLPGFAIYRVKPGDNLWSIGKKYHVSVEDIRELNGLTGEEIISGQKLLIRKQTK